MVAAVFLIFYRGYVGVLIDRGTAATAKEIILASNGFQWS
jgi:hypothetical protein